jgi:hypothetical protein
MSGGTAERPLVSLGVPVYNGEPHLRETLDSIVAQDYRPLEVVISDNASTDATPTICREYADRYPWLRYHRNDANIGAWRNFNQLPDMARGSCFMWVGAHDLLHPTYVRRCVEILESDLGVVAAYSRGRLVDAEGTLQEQRLDEIDTRGLSTLARYLKVIWQTVSCTAVHAVIRTDVLRRTGRFRLDVWGADHLLLAELSLEGPCGQVAETLFTLRDPRGAQTPDVHHRRVAMSMDPTQADRLVQTPVGELWRKTCIAHLEAVARSRLPFAQRLHAQLATLVCFHVRWLIPLTRIRLVDHVLSVAIHRSRIRRLLA